VLLLVLFLLLLVWIITWRRT